MKTKEQKINDLDKARELLKKSESLLFVDFSGIKTENMQSLRSIVRDENGVMVIIKKRLLKVLLSQEGIPFDPMTFEGSVGTVFSLSDLEAAAGPVYRFFADLGENAAENTNRMLGAYDLSGSREISRADIIEIGKLPPREVVLGELLGMLSAPLRGFMHILSERSKVNA